MRAASRLKSQASEKIAKRMVQSKTEIPHAWHVSGVILRKHGQSA